MPSSKAVLEPLLLEFQRRERDLRALSAERSDPLMPQDPNLDVRSPAVRALIEMHAAAAKADAYRDCAAELLRAYRLISS